MHVSSVRIGPFLSRFQETWLSAADSCKNHSILGWRLINRAKSESLANFYKKHYVTANDWNELMTFTLSKNMLSPQQEMCPRVWNLLQRNPFVRCRTEATLTYGAVHYHAGIRNVLTARNQSCRLTQENPFERWLRHFALSISERKRQSVT